MKYYFCVICAALVGYFVIQLYLLASLRVLKLPRRRQSARCHLVHLRETDPAQGSFRCYRSFRVRRRADVATEFTPHLLEKQMPRLKISGQHLLEENISPSKYYIGSEKIALSVSAGVAAKRVGCFLNKSDGGHSGSTWGTMGGNEASQITNEREGKGEINIDPRAA